jgi:hypothetical protein
MRRQGPVDLRSVGRLSAGAGTGSVWLWTCTPRLHSQSVPRRLSGSKTPCSGLNGVERSERSCWTLCLTMVLGIGPAPVLAYSPRFWRTAPVFGVQPSRLA